MIPSTNGFLDTKLQIVEQPSLTYRMNLTENDVRGYADGLTAMEQAIFRILSTERYQSVIYPWWYGVELNDLFGEPATYVCPELERRITEALTTDTRITSVTDFNHDLRTKGVIHTTFVVHTVFGDVAAEREVSV